MSVQTIAYESPAGPWRLHLYQIEPPIKGVQALWGVDGETTAFREKVLPRPGVEWMFNLGTGAHRVLDRNANPKSTHAVSWISGLQRECLYIESPQPPVLIAATLHPAYAASLTGLDASLFTNAVIESPNEKLQKHLQNLPTWPNRFRALEKFLRQLPAQPHPAIATAVDTIIESGGTAPIQQLSAQLALSHKHFVALFTSITGLSPKRFARLVRLARAVEQANTESLNWTALALECGYYDQAHFNREFRLFTGVTPTEFLATREASGQAMIAG